MLLGLEMLALIILSFNEFKITEYDQKNFNLMADSEYSKECTVAKLSYTSFKSMNAKEQKYFVNVELV